MDNHKKTDYISTTILIGLLLLIVEITFFNKGLIFSLLFSGGMIYFGSKRLYGTFGKLVFVLGALILFFSIISMIVFKFLIFAIIAYILFTFFKARNRPILIEPIIQETDRTNINSNPKLFSNRLYGKQKTPDEIYEWHDVNIQAGIGDKRIDLSNTVLPKGESVIAIRNFIGNIQILVPYDIEISVNHSVITGTTTIFEHTDEKLLNQTLVYRTDDYDFAHQKVKIVTSMGIGRLEVRRI